jgi:hypothetical protein
MVGVLCVSHNSGGNSRLVLSLVSSARDLYRYRDVNLDVFISLFVPAKMKSLIGPKCHAGVISRQSKSRSSWQKIFARSFADFGSDVIGPGRHRTKLSVSAGYRLNRAFASFFGSNADGFVDG